MATISAAPVVGHKVQRLVVKDWNGHIIASAIPNARGVATVTVPTDRAALRRPGRHSFQMEPSPTTATSVSIP